MRFHFRRTGGAVAGLAMIAVTLVASAQSPAGRKSPDFVVPHATMQRPITQLIVKYRDEKAATFAKGLSSARMATLASRTGMKLAYRRPMSGMAHVLSLPSAMTPARANEVAATIAQDPNVEYAQPDYVRRPLLVPNDPLYTQISVKNGGTQGQWHLYGPSDNYRYTPAGGVETIIKAIGGASLPSAWDLSQGSGVVVAVVDTGVTAHPDLVANLVGGTPAASGYDFISGNTQSATSTDPFYTANDGDGRDSDPSDPGDWTLTGECGSGEPATDQDSSWHGSHVSGTIAAVTNNGIGVAGIAYQAKLLSVRVLGRCGGLTSDIIDGVRWAAGLPVPFVPVNTHPAKVVNLSLGGSTAAGIDSCLSAEQQAVNDVRAAGAVVVAATGNDGSANIASPASCAGVIAVTAHTVEGDNADYANVGNSGEAVPVNATTLSAPGGGCGTVITSSSSTPCARQYVWSTVNAGTQAPAGLSYGGYAGTSMATPHVSGVAALIESLQPGASPDYVRLLLQGTARPFPSGTYCTSRGGLGRCGAGMLDAAQAAVAAQRGAPAAFAGVPQVAAPGQRVTLHGEAAPLAPGTALTYSWIVLGAGATLSGGTTLAPSFTAPAAGRVDLELTVSEGGVDAVSTTSVYVNNPPVIAQPIAAAPVAEGATASFTAIATDADGDPISFAMVSGPTGATMSDAGEFSWPNAGPAGTYPVVVRASDGWSTSAEVTVEVMVSGVAPPPPTGGGGALGWLGLALLALAAAGLRRNRALR